MHNQLLIDDAYINTNADKQHLHKHLFILEATSTLVQQCFTLNMHSAVKHQMLLCSPVVKTQLLISNLRHHLQSATHERGYHNWHSYRTPA